MNRIRLGQNICSLLLLATVLVSCAATPSGGQGTAVVSSGPASSVSVPTEASPARADCAFLPSAPCATYVSVSGTANGEDLPWVAAGSIKARLTSVNGGPHLSVTTNCGPLSMPVTISGNAMTVGKIATGAVGCEGKVSDQHWWVIEFLKRPIEMTFNQGILTWKSGDETLSFKSE